MKHLPAVVLATAMMLTACSGDPSAEPATPATRSTALTDSPTVATLEQGLPVWWDKDGLHRGDVVEKPAIPLRLYAPGTLQHLALVRTGALYRGRNGDIWFHP